MLNPTGALVAAHDKLLTARVLRRAGVPHPRTWLIANGTPMPVPEFPLVLKPRFGSWGRDVVLCNTRDDFELALGRLARRDWFDAGGVLAQELVEPAGWDLRVVVAGGRVVGGARGSPPKANGAPMSRSAAEASRRACRRSRAGSRSPLPRR